MQGKDNHFRFTNIETPGASLPFYFAGRLWTLEDGGEYPDVYCEEKGMTMSQWLNSLSVDKYEYRQDPATKQVRSVVVGRQPRFSCTPVVQPQAAAKRFPSKDKES